LICGDDEANLEEAVDMRTMLNKRKLHADEEKHEEINRTDALIFERKLGMKACLPGAAQWNILND